MLLRKKVYPFIREKSEQENKATLSITSAFWIVGRIAKHCWRGQKRSWEDRDVDNEHSSLGGSLWATRQKNSIALSKSRIFLSFLKVSLSWRSFMKTTKTARARFLAWIRHGYSKKSPKELIKVPYLNRLKCYLFLLFCGYASAKYRLFVNRKNNKKQQESYQRLEKVIILYQILVDDSTICSGNPVSASTF